MPRTKHPRLGRPKGYISLYVSYRGYIETSYTCALCLWVDKDCGNRITLVVARCLLHLLKCQPQAPLTLPHLFVLVTRTLASEHFGHSAACDLVLQALGFDPRDLGLHGRGLSSHERVPAFGASDLGRRFCRNSLPAPIPPAPLQDVLFQWKSDQRRYRRPNPCSPSQQLRCHEWGSPLGLAIHHRLMSRPSNLDLRH